jgi:hypothetical protein
LHLQKILQCFTSMYIHYKFIYQSISGTHLLFRGLVKKNSCFWYFSMFCMHIDNWSTYINCFIKFLPLKNRCTYSPNSRASKVAIAKRMRIIVTSSDSNTMLECNS